MTKEERLAYIDHAKELELALPEGVEIIDITLHGTGYILLHGSFNFRQFAESKGAVVHSEQCVNPDGERWISLSADLFGCTVMRSLYSDHPAYQQELRLCETR